MAGFLSGFRKPRGDAYSLWRLIDARFLPPYKRPASASKQLVCDIDKTYLETAFESLVKIARIAFEEAGDKVTVHGASEVLLAARWGAMELDPTAALAHSDYPRPLHFVSSSPPQLRRVLEEKLTMDGLDWTSDTFKNQAYNIRKGRFDLLRQQIAYKSAAILSILHRSEGNADFYLIGDNAESDALIYLGIKLFAEGQLSPQAYARFLTIAGVEEKVASDLVERFHSLPPCRIGAILIRKLPGYHSAIPMPLGAPITQFQHFFEVALILMLLEVMELDCLWPLMRRFHNRYGLPREEMLGLLIAAEAWEGTTAAGRQAFSAARQKLIEVPVGLHPLRQGEGGRLPLPCAADLRLLTSLSEEETLTHVQAWVGALENARQNRGDL